MKKIIIGISVFGCALCANAQSTYDEAYQLFVDGEYRQALPRFESLLTERPDNPALVYDIGLCHHLLHEYEQADFYFTQLLSDPEYEYWATYQLAINDWRQGYYGAAEIGLTRVVFESNDADLVELATLRYAELLNTIPTVTTKPRMWLGSVSLGRGQDSNIVDPRFLDASDQRDSYTDVTTSLARQWLRANGHPAWEVQGLLFANRFDEIDSADLTVFAGSLSKFFYRGNWQYTLGLELERSMSGGDNYLQQTAIDLRARSQYGDYTRGWQLRYQFADAKALSEEFRQLAGTSQSAHIEYRIPLSPAWYWRAGVEWMNDDRDPTVNDNLQSDLSAQREGFSTGLVGVFANWNLELAYGARDSHYGDILRIGSGLRVEREDDRERWSLRFDYDLTPHWTLYGEYLDVDNRSNIPRFDYQQKTAVAGIIRYF